MAPAGPVKPEVAPVRLMSDVPVLRQVGAMTTVSLGFFSGVFGFSGSFWGVWSATDEFWEASFLSGVEVCAARSLKKSPIVSPRPPIRPV